MEKSNILNMNRLFLLTRRHLLSNLAGWIIAFAALSGVLLIISLMVAYFQPGSLAVLTPTYLTIMFIGGYIFTSSIFSELNEPRKAFHYLTLPVSLSERLLSAWLLTGIIFPVIALLMIFVIIFLANLIMNLTFDFSPFAYVFSGNYAQAFKNYLITQSVFLLGAAYFRKYNFLKTLLVLFVLFVAFMSIIGLLGWLIIAPLAESSMQAMESGEMTLNMDPTSIKWIPKAANIIYNYLMLPFFLIASWFTLKERQV